MEELIGVLNYTDLKVNSSGGGGDLSNYYTKGETDSQIKKSVDKIKVPTKVSELSNDAGYLTQHQDISNLATKSEVSAIENKIPAAYELPVASATALGGVKVGSGLSITNGVLSATGGGGVADSEPEKYIKDASVSGNTLTLTKKDDTEVVFTPSGGSSGGGGSYTLPIATETTLGGIKVFTNETTALGKPIIGTAVYFNEDKAEVAYVPLANENHPGVVSVFRNNGLNCENGTIKMSSASTNFYGTVAYDGITIKQNDNTIKQLYVPAATTSSAGIVKPDGTTTTVDSQGNLSMIGKPAVIKTLITGKAPDWVVDWVANPDKYIVMVNGCVVFKTIKYDNFPNFYYYWIDNDRIENYYIKFTDTTFTTPASSQPSYSVTGTQLITTDNWQNYITAGGGSDWQYTQDQSNSDLYNAKELVVYAENSNGLKQMGYFNFGADGNLGNSHGSYFYFDYNSSSPYIYYDGSNLGYGNVNNLQYIYYKT